MQLLYSGGLQPQLYSLEAGKLLIAMQQGWKVDAALHFLVQQRAEVDSVEWAGRSMTPRQLRDYLQQRDAKELRERVRQRRKRGPRRKRSARRRPSADEL